jgi:hypothetical protein
MTTNIWIARLSAAALLTIAGTRTNQAADRIRYDEIPARLAPFGSVLAYRGFNVITLDGKKHGGRRLRLEPDHLRIFHLNNSWEDLPSEQISEIKISQGGRFFHHTADSAEIPLELSAIACGGLEGNPVAACLMPVTALFSPVWAYTAATAPFHLASDGVAFLIPPKVYKIVP